MPLPPIHNPKRSPSDELFPYPIISSPGDAVVAASFLNQVDTVLGVDPDGKVAALVLM
jgi:hypothetical protein